MHDLLVVLAGLLVGFTVGLTGMGGGALMTPVLVLLFQVHPFAAISSDLVASMVMKPVGGLVHLRKGTVFLPLVGWLMLGSVPAAFTGVLVLRGIGPDATAQHAIRITLGAALLLAVTGLVAKALMNLRATSRARLGGHLVDQPASVVTVRPVPTLALGALGGFIVGVTSVGSGSIIIVILLLLYPRLRASQLVGTDLVQAVPLVTSAAVGHLLFGEFRLGLTATLLIGCIPGTYIGAKLSSSAPGWVVRRALALVLLVSGLKLLGISDRALLTATVVALTITPAVWALVRVAHGLPYRHGARAPSPGTGSAGRKPRLEPAEAGQAAGSQ